jgi:hypothetical protein
MEIALQHFIRAMPENNPPKHYRESKQRFYSEDAKTYLPAFPLVWTPSEEIESYFAKLYDVVVTHYADQYGWLKLIHLGLYCYLLTYARAERAIVIDNFARQNKITERTLIAAIDRLQDVELCDRVMRPDHRGRPVDLVLRPPLAPSALVKGEADRIRDNIEVSKTRILRAELGKDFPGADNRFSEKEVTGALSRNWHGRGKTRKTLAELAERFHDHCLKANYNSIVRFPDASDTERKDYFMREVSFFCSRNEIEFNHEVSGAALEIRRHYGRTPFKL